MAKIPTANVYWRDLKPGACVIDRGNLFIAKIGRKRAVVYWEGREARAAQAALRARAGKNCKR